MNQDELLRIAAGIVKEHRAVFANKFLAFSSDKGDVRVIGIDIMHFGADPVAIHPVVNIVMTLDMATQLYEALGQVLAARRAGTVMTSMTSERPS